MLSIEGDFTFDLHQKFRNAYKGYEKNQRFTVDLSKANYMDSSGLGMLVQLREFAGGDSAHVKITGANEVISQVLAVAKFNKLFTLN